MKKISLSLLGAVALLAAAPAAAAPRGYYAPQYAPASNNAIRLEIGGASLSSPGIYCPNGPNGGCSNDGPFGWGSLSLGGALDVGLGNSPVAFTIAAHELAASYESGAPNIFEPSFGLTFRLLRYQPTQLRLGVGVGLLFAESGDTGAALKLGAGLSFFANAPIGLALDFGLDVGRWAGYGVSQFQVAIGPEFHF
jgi:hypothetical protein